MVILLKIEKGMYVTRKSYNNDIIFKIINIKDGICYLKGNEVRLLADSPVDDLKILSKEKVTLSEIEAKPKEERSSEKSDFFFLPAKVMHIDGDSEFLDRCLKFYKSFGILAVGKKIKEDKIYQQIGMLLREYNPDIVIITGHDSYNKDSKDKTDLKNYKNSEYFIKAVKEARKFEKSHEKLVIIAGACQSDYEELIKAGANYASSPKRVNIHALDPAIIAKTLALTERDKPIDLVNMLNETKYGKDGMGGIQSNGLMYIGYPR